MTDLSLLQDRPLPRRSFLQLTGASAATVLLAACSKDENTTPGMVDVGSGDLGVLNYAYALEQLEASFYALVLQSAYFDGTTAAEKQILTDLALHEKIHVDFFRATLANTRIRDLEPDFSSINFADRAAVLGAARMFEDLGVAAYNGAAQFLTRPEYLLLAGKIVSVEARHAALIRDLLTYNTFVGSDVVDVFTPTSAQSGPGDGNGTGLEKHLSPTEVVAKANDFLRVGSKLSVANLK